MLTSIITLLIIFFLGVLLNALFAGYETGFVASNPVRVRSLADNNEHTQAKRLLSYIEEPDRMLTVVLIGTNVALMMGTLGLSKLIDSLMLSPTSQATADAAATAALITTLIATPIFLVFGEVLPKSIFREHPTRLALQLLPVIRFFDLLFAPIAIPVAWLSQRFIRLMGAEQRDMNMMRSTDDVRILVDESANQGTIEPEEQEMIHSVIDLQERFAKEAMIPRIDIKALASDASRKDLANLFQTSGLTRVPIYEESIDNITGMVNAFDLLTDTTPDDQSIRRFIKDIIHVPDSMRLDDVLQRLREAGQRIAVVTDEFGGTDGLITLEDILEEIFGEIADEHDKKKIEIQEITPNAWIVDARAPLEDLAQAMKITLADEEVETVGGWIMHIAGYIPAQGEMITHKNFQITILIGSPNAISRVRIEHRPELH